VDDLSVSATTNSVLRRVLQSTKAKLGILSLIVTFVNHFLDIVGRFETAASLAPYMHYIPSWQDLWASVEPSLYNQISLFPGMIVGFSLIAWAVRDVIRADQVDPKPNVRLSGIRISPIQLGATYQWTHASTYPDDSTFYGLLAQFSNVPLDRPIGDAFPVRARVTYVNPQGEAAAMNPAPWVDEQHEATSLKAGETRELILAVSPINSQDRFLKGLEDRRKAGGVPYVHTPGFSSTDATVTLTVNGLIQGPYQFRLDAAQNPPTIKRLHNHKRFRLSSYFPRIRIKKT
jgi:hypothetical protein